MASSYTHRQHQCSDSDRRSNTRMDSKLRGSRGHNYRSWKPIFSPNLHSTPRKLGHPPHCYNSISSGIKRDGGAPASSSQRKSNCFGQGRKTSLVLEIAHVFTGLKDNVEARYRFIPSRTRVRRRPHCAWPTDWATKPLGRRAPPATAGHSK